MLNQFSPINHFSRIIIWGYSNAKMYNLSSDTNRKIGIMITKLRNEHENEFCVKIWPINLSFTRIKCWRGRKYCDSCWKGCINSFILIVLFNERISNVIKRFVEFIHSLNIWNLHISFQHFIFKWTFQFFTLNKIYNVFHGML